MGTANKRFTLEDQGITGIKKVYWDLNVGQLYEEAIKRGEAWLTKDGALLAETGKYTGRSPNDKFTVKEPSSEANVWWGKVNKSFDAAKFDALYARVLEHLKGKEVFVQDCFGGCDPTHRLPIRIVNEFAWHNLFARNMFVRIDDKVALENHKPEYTVIYAPNFKADPARDGTNSEAFIIPHLGKKVILIGGTSYAGECKKSVFSLLNYILPLKGVLSMHCSANIGRDGDTAVFFGLSGTGKTTLSADPDRSLIGDDEHGWSDEGVFNFEGGCYAKAIKLSKEAEPEIYDCVERFGTILENVVMDKDTRVIDLDDATLAENTRASYPIDFIPNAVPNGRGGIPKTIIMLTADAFGVLPPVAKLTSAQAMYHFLSGYTAKVAGTERGIKEPQATFSPCFGGPFMTLHPGVYAKLLGEKIAQNKVECYLVNTGWSGGPYGVGNRVPIKASRAIVKAALSGALKNVKTVKDPVMGLEVPTECPGVPDASILIPRNTWADKAAYDEKAKHLAGLFRENFKQYAEGVSEEIRNAGPIG